MLSDGIQNIYIINMDKDVDRLQQVTQECKKINPFLTPKRIPGVDMSKGFPENLMAYYSPLTPVISKSAIGCGLAHITAWETLVRNGDSSALILEDDAEVVDNFQELFDKISKTVPGDYDIIYLGCYIGCDINKEYGYEYSVTKLAVKPNKVIKINDNVFVPAIPLALHGYILSNKGARYLLSCFERNKLYSHVDLQLMGYLSNCKVYAVDPKLINQRTINVFESNNTSAKYPRTLNTLFSLGHTEGFPLAYNLSIANFEIFGIPINAYTLITLVLGIVIGRSVSPTFKNYKLVSAWYLVFAISEFLMLPDNEKFKGKVVTTLVKNEVFTYLVLLLGVYIGNWSRG